MNPRWIVPVLLALALGCGTVVEIPTRDENTAAYIGEVFRVPSFWIERDADDQPVLGQEVVVTFLVRDDIFPDGVEPDELRDTFRAALEVWHEPLRAAGRRVRLPVMWASDGVPPPERHVEVEFVGRARDESGAYLGATWYNEAFTQARVEISVRALSLERFLTRRELLALTIHELGHALGISRSGHSPDANDVMFAHNLDNTWVSLSDGDRRTLLMLYPR